MATYGAVVPMMQDLRWLLSSFDRILYFEEFLGLPEWKKGLQFLYENVCLMDSLLRVRDYTAESFYDPDLIKRFESRITDVVYRTGSYVDLNTIDILEKLLSIRGRIKQETPSLTRFPSIGLMDLSAGDFIAKNNLRLIPNMDFSAGDFIAESNLRLIDLNEIEMDFSAGDFIAESNLRLIDPNKIKMDFSAGDFIAESNLRLIDPNEIEMDFLAGDFIDPNEIEIWVKLLVSRPRKIRRLCPGDFLSMASRGLEPMNEEIACINEELQKISADIQSTQNSVEDDGSSIAGKSFTILNTSQRPPIERGKLVGLDNDLVKMLDCLTRLPLKLQVFAVTGMAGIGKTTFTGQLYDDPLVRHHFYLRAWVTISRDYQVKETLLGLLNCVTNLSIEMYEFSHEQLREHVYQCLKGKRYLIILDDMWDDKDWNDLRMTFPDDKNGSRIILTSRLTKVASNVSPDNPPHHMQCLSQDESWELLCSTIFMNQPCPQELIKIGEQISCRCQGLPLAIVVVGGLLSKMEKTLKVWEEVEQSVGSFVMKDTPHCENILALSYDHLPDPLKTCFLYMGLFPEDCNIHAQKLIWLWIAEGFILPVTGRRLEEVAESYLEDLTARSLVMVKKRSNGRIKICSIHDLMRGLCLRISENSNFLSTINNVGHPRSSIENHREGHETNLRHLARISFHAGFLQHTRSGTLLYHTPTLQHMHSRTAFKFIRSCFCFETITLTDLKHWRGIGFKLLRVLDIMNLHQSELAEELLLLVHLRYLAITVQNSLRTLLSSKLRNLQTIIVNYNWDGVLPLQFWKMLEIRHFHIKSSRLPFLSNSPSHINSLSYRRSEISMLPNLLSLSTICPKSCSKKNFLSMPKLMKLGVLETEDDKQHRGWLENLVYLPELESLKYTFSNPFIPTISRPKRFSSCIVFPPKLLKFTLSGTSYPWEDMFELSLLPNLEVLKLKNYAFSGPVWKSTEGGFLRLKFLQIGSTNLEHWESNGTNFPSLQHIVLRHCRSLTEIPPGIGDAPLLEKIELHCCGESAVRSARQIQEEQRNSGNDLLTVYITGR